LQDRPCHTEKRLFVPYADVPTNQEVEEIAIVEKFIQVLLELPSSWLDDEKVIGRTLGPSHCPPVAGGRPFVEIDLFRFFRSCTVSCSVE
jgi:hypothetical protein